MKSHTREKKYRVLTLLVSVFFVMAMMPVISDGQSNASSKTVKFRLSFKADEYSVLYADGEKAVNKEYYETGTVFTVKNKKGYQVRSFSVNDVDMGAVNTYTPAKKDLKQDEEGEYQLKIVLKSIRNPSDSSVTLLRTDTIGGKWPGTIKGIPDGETKIIKTLKYGAKGKYKISVNKGFYLVKVLVDGKSIGQTENVNLTGDGKNHTIQANFANARFKLKIDPGHAGKYNSGAAPGYWESEMTWKLSNILKKRINKYPGVKATLTKKSLIDDPEVYVRGTMAKGNDLFVSIHSNSSSSSSSDYPLTIVPFAKEQLYKLAQPLGKALGKGLEKTMKTSEDFKVWTKKQSDGRDWYGVIRGASDVGVAGIIIEHSFHSNPGMARWLMKTKNLKKLAKMEAKTISHYYGLKGDGTLEKPDTPDEVMLSAGKKKTTMRWRKRPVTGYEVYRATRSNGKYKPVNSTTGTVSKDTGLKRDKEYFYKVRAYRCNGQKISYSKFSKVFSVTTE